jgi:hypothetical protein
VKLKYSEDCLMARIETVKAMEVKHGGGYGGFVLKGQREKR